jgi:methionyl-tRNA formyltransferase
MDDPVQTKSFISRIIDARKKDIIGVALTSDNRLTLRKGKSKVLYIISLFLIMGLFHFIKNSIITVLHAIKKKIHALGLIKDPTIAGYAAEQGIKVYKIKSPNNKNFLAILKELYPDIIINQSQSILKKDLLQIPKIGVINRHNALLPKNRGRLTPFWVLFKEEKETGVSIHFVEEKMDSGKIVVQERFTINKNDTFNTLVEKNYQIAPAAMLKAIDLLEQGFTGFLDNNDELATYNSTPTLKEAFQYRKKRILIKFFNHKYFLF